LILKGETLAGVIDLHAVSTADASCMIGYWIASEFEGRGLITRACLALLSHCFEQLDLERAGIRCAVGNTRSNAIPRRLGFTLEGVARHAQRLHDGFVDLEIYSLLRAEWLARPR